jgi:hypothetical protein
MVRPKPSVDHDLRRTNTPWPTDPARFTEVARRKMCSGDHDFQCAAVVHRAGNRESFSLVLDVFFARPPGIRKEQNRRQPTEAPTALLSSPTRAPDTFGLSDRRRLKGHRMSRLGKRVVLLRLFYGGEMRKCVVGRGGFAISVCFPPYPQEPCHPHPV